MADPLVETWQIHNRINLYLLDAIADEALGSTLNNKGRSVRDQWSHVHNVRPDVAQIRRARTARRA